MKAVLVDDEYYTMLGMKMELESIEGMSVLGMFKSGEELLKELDSLDPDIIFLDIEMPEMNGLELCSRIIEKNCSARIVFVTAFNKYAVDAFELNALDYILKPVTKERLIKTVNRVAAVPTPFAGERKLFIRCFKRFAVVSDNKEVNLEWRTHKAQELIAYLINERGIYISKEKIAETLWQDMPDNRGIDKLYLAYYYIKKQEKMLGITFPIESERGRMRIKLDDLECDVLLFDELIAKCAIVDKNNVDMAVKAEELYIGGLFEDNYYEWSIIDKEKYEVAYEGLLNKLATFYKSINNKEKMKHYSVKLKKLEE